MIILETHYRCTALGQKLPNGSYTSLLSFGFSVLLTMMSHSFLETDFLSRNTVLLLYLTDPASLSHFVLPDLRVLLHVIYYPGERCCSSLTQFFLSKD